MYSTLLRSIMPLLALTTPPTPVSLESLSSKSSLISCLVAVGDIGEGVPNKRSSLVADASEGGMFKVAVEGHGG